MATNHISVKVCGNPDSNSGFIPIILYNSPLFAVEDQFYVGFDDCSYFYTIKTTPTHTIFKLIKNNVRSYGAARAGSLVIAFSIPKNYALDDGYTPYYVLGMLKDKFLKECMTCKDPIRETYEYNSGRIDQHILDEVADEFTISPAPSPNRVMAVNAPKGYIVRSDIEIEKLFHDINYPEFDSFSEVIVAESVSQTNYTPISNIQIPRLKNYEIYVDGMLQQSCTDVNQLIQVSSQKSSEYYENKTISFTIQNLKDGDNYPEINFQEACEKVEISTLGWAKPKSRTISVRISPNQFQNYFLTNRKLLKVEGSYGYIDLDQKLSFTLVGEQIAQIARGNIKVKLDPNDKCTLSSYAIVDNELRITVEEIKRQPPQVMQVTKQQRYQQLGSTEISVVKPSPVYDVVVSLSNEKFKTGDYQIDVQLMTDNENYQPLIATCLTTFKQSPKSHLCEGHFYIPKEHVTPDTYLSFRIDDCSYRTQRPFHVNNDTIVINDSDVVSSKAPVFYKSKKFIIALFYIFTLIGGCCVGYVSHDGVKTVFTKGDQGKGAENGNIIERKEEAIRFLQNADSILHSHDLKFSDINEIYESYKRWEEAYLKKIDEENTENKVCNRINDYFKVYQDVREGDVNGINEKLKEFPKNEFHIWAYHADCLRLLIKDEKAKDLFKKEAKNITSFNEIKEKFTIKSTAQSASQSGANASQPVPNSNDTKYSER